MKNKLENSKPYLFVKRVINAFRRSGFRVITRRLKRLFGILDYSILFLNKNEYVDTDSSYQDNIDFSDEQTDIKMLAYYLPQFHTFKENDEWWGKGFTEWTNTKSATPRFSGHYQPRTPHKDIGYYDLSDIEVLKRQVELAKQHKIYGFCFYYYWFSGKRLMEKPLDLFLEHSEIDFPFCLCWANENWTRTWDGKSKNVLISQDYSKSDDERFIEDLKKYIDDKRYIRINNKPLIMVYNPAEIPNASRTFNKWRETAKKLGIGDICIWTCRTFLNTAKKLKIENLVDAEVQFPPHNTKHSEFVARDISVNDAFVYNYQRVAEAKVYDYKTKRDLTEQGSKPLYRTVMLGWDNAARRKSKWTAYHHFSLKSLYDWTLTVCDQARRDFKSNERFVFVNAFNEWAEGTYLEPDEKYGYANINTISKALTNKPLCDDLVVINDNSESGTVNKKIAVQVHMFYLETLSETIENLNKIPFPFDCYVSTDTLDKAQFIEKQLSQNCKCNRFVVEVFENRGRDVAPFILQMRRYIKDYDYICHIHSKRTVTGEYGNDWREYIFKHLFGNENYLKGIFSLFENNENLGIVFPETFPPLLKQCEWGQNLKATLKLFERLGVTVPPPQNPVFPVGNMFWAKTKAVKGIFESDIEPCDFAEENRQVNGTIAHCIERSWVYLAAQNGFTYSKVFNNCSAAQPEKDQKRIAFYAHFNKDGVLSDDDFKSLQHYKDVFEKIVFISNSPLSELDIKRVESVCDTVIFRENEGYDFAAWREGLENEGYENLKQYDKLALINNSTLLPLFSIKNVFAKFENEDCDFYGITLFPKLNYKKYLNTKSIAEHLQSYFLVFNKKIINSCALKEFFDNLKNTETLIDAIKNGEAAMTKFLSDKGYTYKPYLSETYYIWDYLEDHKIPYDKPLSLVLLGNPFVKKKAYDYMSSDEKIALENFIKKLK